MINRANLLSSPFRALILVTCAAVGATIAFAAADFPLGSYAIEGYAIVFADEGKFRVNKGDEVLVEGEYTVKGDRLQLTDKHGPIACTREGHETGTYGWKYEGEALTLSKVEDKCEGRAAAMTARPWKRKK
ncbi:MAG: hypothetical protein M3R15_05825 [Acidobacteriota bacterium]|nr:hypothetical protein [Acidobacteriota bacterium]